MIAEDQRFVKVNNDAAVQLSSPCVVTNKCRLDIEQFPFDIQQCSITLGSWMYPASQIDLIPKRTLRNPNVTDYDDYKYKVFNIFYKGLSIVLTHDVAVCVGTYNITKNRRRITKKTCRMRRRFLAVV